MWGVISSIVISPATMRLVVNGTECGPTLRGAVELDAVRQWLGGVVGPGGDFDVVLPLLVAAAAREAEEAGIALRDLVCWTVSFGGGEGAGTTVYTLGDATEDEVRARAATATNNAAGAALVGPADFDIVRRHFLRLMPSGLFCQFTPDGSSSRELGQFESDLARALAGALAAVRAVIEKGKKVQGEGEPAAFHGTIPVGWRREVVDHDGG